MRASIEEFRELCARAGLRVTAQRWEIFRCLRNATDHPDAEAVYREVRNVLPAISLDTVYRTLDTFTRSGIAARVTTVCARARFDGNTAPHPHAVCVSCGAMHDVHHGSVAPEPPATIPGFACIHSSHLEFRGVCEACARA
jgi:Fur family peroxide stress response transcriptional regulator